MDTIIHESCEYGHISEHVYDRLNIVRDRDSLGREVMPSAELPALSSLGCHSACWALTALAYQRWALTVLASQRWAVTALASQCWAICAGLSKR